MPAPTVFTESFQYYAGSLNCQASTLTSTLYYNPGRTCVGTQVPFNEPLWKFHSLVVSWELCSCTDTRPSNVVSYKERVFLWGALTLLIALEHPILPTWTAILNVYGFLNVQSDV